MFAEWRSKMTTYKVQKCNPLKNMYIFYQLTDFRSLRPLCAINPPADGLDLTMKRTLNAMFDYCSMPLGAYFKLGAQAGFLSNFEKSPYLCFWRSRLA